MVSTAAITNEGEWRTRHGSMPEQQRATVEKLSVLMANDGRKDQNPEGLPLASEQIQRNKW